MLRVLGWTLIPLGVIGVVAGLALQPPETLTAQRAAPGPVVVQVPVTTTAAEPATAPAVVPAVLTMPGQSPPTAPVTTAATTPTTQPHPAIEACPVRSLAGCVTVDLHR